MIFILIASRLRSSNGTFMSGFDLGIGTGAILCGLIAKLAGYSVMYLLTLLPITVAFFLYLVALKNVLSWNRPKAFSRTTICGGYLFCFTKLVSLWYSAIGGIPCPL